MITYIIISAILFFLVLIGLMIDYSKFKSINWVVRIIITLIISFLGAKITLVLYEIPLKLFFKYIGVPSISLALIIRFLMKDEVHKSKKTDDKKILFQLETDQGTIKFYDPFNNFLVYGGQGAGKTLGIGKPLMREYIKNNFAGFVYDIKDEDYTKAVYHLIKEYNYPYSFYYANFIDLSRSHRFNLLSRNAVPTIDMIPQLISDLLIAYTSKDHKRDEWFNAGLGLLKGVAVRFYKDFPEHCTIPHIFNFCLHNSKQVLTDFVSKDFQSKAYASAFVDSAGSPKTQDGFLSSLTGIIGDLAGNKKICYVLSGNDFDFNLIDPKNPKLFAISNNYGLQDMISPVVALTVKISSRHFSLNNRVPFVYSLDEATTFKIENFEGMPSLLREYRVSFLFITQSSSKITTMYGKEALSSIEANFVNQFYGRTQDIVALEKYPKMFSKKKEKKESFSSSTGSNNNSSTSKSYRIDKVLKYESEDFKNLEPFQFIGTSNSNQGEFKLKFNMFEQPQNLELPIVRMVTDKDIEDNYLNIINVVKSLI